ncbi:MAG: outer membrane lipoprotein carrier protein LolA [Chitinophagaceae bacterium]|nr:MAG: outer membrane lipoprotein carrier protein LolA [Chitinophagaceae bacterium]
MKKIAIAFSLFLTATAAFAQAKGTQNDPQAKKVLDAVSAKFKTFTTVQAGFTYKIENASGKALSSKTGTLSMKGQKYRVSLGGMEIFSDGKTVWNYDKSSNEVTISNLDASAATLTPQKLFTNFYDKDFYSVLNGEKKQGAKTIQEIEMTPVDKSKAFHKVYLYVDKGTQTISSSKVLQSDGNRYSYSVSNMKTNTTIADTQFTFNKASYPGVEVIDLR